MPDVTPDWKPRKRLRRRDKEAGMERVRGLSWADNTAASKTPESAENTFASFLAVEAGGFEPPFDDFPHEHTAGREQPAESLDDVLVGEARKAPSAGQRDDADAARRLARPASDPEGQAGTDPTAPRGVSRVPGGDPA